MATPTVTPTESILHLSDFPQASAGPATNDTLVGVTAGKVDVRFLGSQLSTIALSPTQAHQSFSGGATVQTLLLASGNVICDPGARPLQAINNTAAFTLTAPTVDGTMLLMVTNGTGAGPITFAGFTVGANVGDTLDTTPGHIFTLSVWCINGVAGYRVAAHQ